LDDQPYLQAVRQAVQSARERLCKIAVVHDLTPLPSATNFVTMDCGRDMSFAKTVLTELLDMDIFVRMPGAAPLDRCIRVSCGTEAEIDVFEKALPGALEAARRRSSLII